MNNSMHGSPHPVQLNTRNSPGARPYIITIVTGACPYVLVFLVLVVIFTELHTLTQATRSYALLLPDIIIIMAFTHPILKLKAVYYLEPESTGCH